MRRAADKTSSRLSGLALLGLAAVALAPAPLVGDVFAKMTSRELSAQRPDTVIATQSLPGTSANDASAPLSAINRQLSRMPLVALSPVAARPVVVAAAGAQLRPAKLAKNPPRKKLAARDVTARDLALRDAEKRDREMHAAAGSPAPKGPSSGTLSDADLRVAKVDAVVAPPGVVTPGVATYAAPMTVVAEWSTEEIAAARKQCTRLLAKSAAVTSDAEPIKDGACGTPAPVSLRRAGTPPVDVQPAATMTCDVAATLSNWLTDKVQPVAKELFNSPVVRLVSASSYACRNRYGRPDSPLSEHALANAIDIAGFVLANGTVIKVVEGWGPTARDPAPKPAPSSAEVAPESKPNALKGKMSGLGARDIAAARTAQSNAKDDAGEANETPTSKTDPKSVFLHRVHEDACGLFGTVLGPEANEAHRDHLHLDMKSRTRSAYCQ